MNYIDRIAGNIGDRCGMCMSDPEQRRLLRLYAVLALTRGWSTTREDVHNAWAAWRLETRPEHPAIVPFALLDGPTQELDEPYRKAIADVARSL